MAEELNKQGLFVDDLYVLRVCEPNVTKETQDLTENNAIFLDSLFLSFMKFLRFQILFDFKFFKLILNFNTNQTKISICFFLLTDFIND